MPLTRIRSSTELKGRKLTICAARAGPICTIMSKASVDAELMSTCPGPPHPATPGGTVVGVGARVGVGVGLGVAVGTGVGVGLETWPETGFSWVVSYTWGIKKQRGPRMLGERSDQRGLWEADRLYLDHVGKDTFYGLLASLRGRLFRDADFAEFYCPDNGRDSVPPSLLATAPRFLGGRLCCSRPTTR